MSNRDTTLESAQVAPNHSAKLPGCGKNPILVGENAHQSEVLRKRGAALKIEAEVLDGSPKDVILNVAEEWGADLIVVGPHGYGPVKKFLLGSVSQAVASHARCSVEIVRGVSADSKDKAAQPEQILS